MLKGVALLGLCVACSTPSPPEQRARELSQEFVIVDGHVDVPFRLEELAQKGEPVDDVSKRTAKGDFDYERAREGGFDAPFMSIYTPAEAADEGRSKALADRLIDLVEELARLSPQKFEMARSAADVRRIAASGRIAFLLGMENGSPLEGSLANLDHFHKRGVRYITLCHGKDNDICDSSYDKSRTHRGLTSFGREVVLRMNELGVLVDVSHISDDSFWQVIKLTRAPVIASHSSMRYFVPGFERNISDEMVTAVGQNGGVVMINFGSSFLTHEANEHMQQRKELTQSIAAELGLKADAPEVELRLAEWAETHPLPYARVADVADHIDRAVRFAGIEHVGLGSDFDGVGDSLPVGLKSVADYPNLIAELLRRGYSESDVRKICGENVLRALAAAAQVAHELERTVSHHIRPQAGAALVSLAQ